MCCPCVRVEGPRRWRRWWYEDKKHFPPIYASANLEQRRALVCGGHFLLHSIRNCDGCKFPNSGHLSQVLCTTRRCYFVRRVHNSLCSGVATLWLTRCKRNRKIL